MYKRQALAFLTFSVALYLFNYRTHAKKAFLFSLFLFISPAILVIKESVLSIFPTWVSILVLIVIGSIMLRYIFELLFGSASHHVLGDLISSAIKYIFKLIMYIPKLIFSNKRLHATSKTIGKTIVLKCKKLTLFFTESCKYFFTCLKNEKRTKSAIKLVKKIDEDF